MNMGFDNKIVLVTGSTKGIGKAMAQAFLREGARVIINGRDEEAVAAAAAELSSLGVVYGIAADISNAAKAIRLIEEAEKLGEIDVLVNNVGIFEAKPFEEVDDEEWMHYFNVNVMSAVRLSRLLLPKLLTRNAGKIVMISSEAGLKPLPLMIHYSVTKTALIGLARGLAELTRGTNVTVSSLLPGPTWTEGVERFMFGAAEAAGQELDAYISEYFRNNEPTSLLQRFATVEEVADTAVFLCSERASAMNGSALRVEGGIIRSL